MGYASQEGQIGFRTQTSEGSFVDPGAASPNNGIFIRHKSGGLTINRDPIIPDPEIGGNRDITDAYGGPASYSGDIEFYARMGFLPTIVKAALGTGASVVTGTVAGTDLLGVHTITPTDSILNLPWLSIEEAIASGLENFRYTDSHVNTLSLSCDPDNFLMGTAGLIAKTGLAGITRTVAPVVDTSPLLLGTSMAISIGGVSTYILRNWKMDFTNNIEDNTFQLGSTTLADLTGKRRELTMSATIRPNGGSANALFREAAFGSSSATGPLSGANVQKAVTVLIESYALIGSGIADHFSLSISVPTMIIKPFPLKASGDDVIEYDVEFEAIRPVPGTPLCTFVIKNGLTTIK